jgi:L-aspartate oxidase
MCRGGVPLSRTAELRQAREHVVSLLVETKAVYKNFGVNTELVELLNLATVAELVVSCALQRRESRGLHYSVDYPFLDEQQRKPSLISTSLKKRLDLQPYLQSVYPVGAGGPASAVQVKRGARRGMPSRDREVAIRASPNDL